jgi:hypothetical protein
MLDAAFSSIKEINKPIPVIIWMKEPNAQEWLEFGALCKNITAIARKKANAATAIGWVDVQDIATIATPNDALDLNVLVRSYHFTDTELHITDWEIKVTNLRTWRQSQLTDGSTAAVRVIRKTHKGDPSRALKTAKFRV